MDNLDTNRHPIALPWLVLVSPADAWQWISRTRRPWIWAIILHWLLGTGGQLAAVSSSQELLVTAGLAARQTPITAASVISLAIFTLVAILASVTAGALIGMGILRIIGSRMNFSQAFTWVSYALIPLSIGGVLGNLMFSIVRPLADSPATALAYLIRPFSLNINGLFPSALPPLSFGWFVAVYLDIFGIWSIFLLYRGATAFVSLDLKKKLWLIAGLMIVFLAVITGLWNLTQFALLQISG